MYKTQEKYQYQQVYAEYCVHCKHEQANECTLALYKNKASDLSNTGYGSGIMYYCNNSVNLTYKYIPSQ